MTADQGEFEGIERWFGRRQCRCQPFVAVSGITALLGVGLHLVGAHAGCELVEYAVHELVPVGAAVAFASSIASLMMTR